LKIFLWVTLASLSLVVSLNFVVDTAGIYHDKALTPGKYASALLQSKKGLLWPEGLLAARKLAKALAKHSPGYDCVVIGSSHIKEISSVRNNKSLKGLCPSILNLGVLAASLEDHITLSYLVIQSGFKKNIILGVDPWTLAYNKDVHWLKYADDYRTAQLTIFGNTNNLPRVNTETMITNLINLDYALRSLSLLMKYINQGIPSITHATSLNHKIGLSDPVKLPDGSNIFSQKYLQKTKNPKITVDDGRLHMYKLNTPVSLPEAVNDYQLLLEWIFSSEAKPHILLTPYHHSAWAYNDTPVALAMQKTEKIVRDIGYKLGVTVYGSYNPSMVNCDEDEFYDVMHAKVTCLSKINVDR